MSKGLAKIESNHRRSLCLKIRKVLHVMMRCMYNVVCNECSAAVAISLIGVLETTFV